MRKALHAMVRLLSVGVLCALLALPCAAYADENTANVADSSDYATREDVGTQNMTPIYASDIADGTYSVIVETDSSMFKVVECDLTVSGDTMTAVVELSSDGYQYLYMGTGEQASALDASEYAEYVKNEDGDYTYYIGEVSALNSEVQCCAFSKRREQWYDHDIVFLASSLPMSALSESAQQAVKASTAVAGLADGVYTIPFDSSGDDGALQSPATMRMYNGVATVRLKWAGDECQQITIAGETYTPTSTSADMTVFDVPLWVFDTQMPTTAVVQDDDGEFDDETVWMSFHSGMIEAAADESDAPEAVNASEASTGGGSTSVTNISNAAMPSTASTSSATSAAAASGQGGSAASGGMSPIGIVVTAVVVVAVVALLIVLVRKNKAK